MFFKSIKLIVGAGLGLALAGGVLFGTDLGSYVRSSANSVRTAVTDAVPIDFQLKRAHDMLQDVIPEMHANIKLIAQQEVEITNLKTDLTDSQKALANEAKQVQALRNCMLVSHDTYNVGGVTYTQAQLTEELSNRFDRYKEAEVILASKQRLLENREKALRAGMDMLERTRAQKAMLENKIAALESQFRLIQAASVGSNLSIDHSKLAKTEKLIADIKNQLDVAERVMAHEARFTQTISTPEVVDPKHLLAEVDEHFAPKTANVEKPTDSEKVPALTHNDR